MSDADATAIADYLSKKPFVRAKQTVDAAKAEHGKKIHETGCMKPRGWRASDDDAGISGQWMPTFVIP
jgi:hypothetical protein